MKLVVFAHTPPPRHGQSYMVQLMLDGLGTPALPPPSDDAARAPDIQCHHVNARLSDGLDDVGSVRLSKVFRILGYCLQALWFRLRHRARCLYYIPSPPKRASLYRDWLVLLLCRPWFHRIAFHWHAMGLGEFLETTAHPWERRLTHWLLGRVDLSIALTRLGAADAARLHPKRLLQVENGIPDPCPDFDRTLHAQRRARLATRRHALDAAFPRPSAATPPGPIPVEVLYLAHCTRDKGLFETLDGVLAANRRLAERAAPLRLKLTVAGSFMDAREKAEFEARAAEAAASGTLRLLGFVSGPDKDRLLRQSDLFCFPTYYSAEAMPVGLIEAMAYALPIVTTRWRALPDFLPPGYPGLVEPRRAPEVATALLEALAEDPLPLRTHYLERFTLNRHLDQLAAALRSME